MSEPKDIYHEFLFLKIIQSGEIIRIALTDMNLKKNLKEFYIPILKRLKLKEKSVFISNEEGQMLGNSDLILPLKEISIKFGNRLKLYSEKVF
ncbi:MAG: hypothetical protein ACFE8L_04115 [Candidatus Hodarchaeota archaeon]